MTDFVNAQKLHNLLAYNLHEVKAHLLEINSARLMINVPGMTIEYTDEMLAGDVKNIMQEIYQVFTRSFSAMNLSNEFIKRDRKSGAQVLAAGTRTFVDRTDVGPNAKLSAVLELMDEIDHVLNISKKMLDKEQTTTAWSYLIDLYLFDIDD